MSRSFSEMSALSSFTDIKMLQFIFNSLADGVIVADREGRFILFNPLAESILGIGMTNAVPENWSEVYGCFKPDGTTPFPSHELPLVRALAGESVGDTEIVIRNPIRPGGIRILARANPLRNEAGELCGGVVVICDITRRKETEDMIRTLTNAVEQTADTIVITDRDGRITYVNPAFEQTTGYTRNEVLGRFPSILKSGVHDAAFYADLWSTITSGRVFRATITNRKKDGTIYFAEQTITPMTDSADVITHFVSVVKDVTESRKLEEQETQMRLARGVQQQFYRMSPPHVDGYDIAGAAYPADATGGDYFDFITLPGDCLGISVGDIAGHGIGSALLMVILRSYLRAFASKSVDVPDMLASLNNALVSDLEEDRFATLAFCRLHPASRSVVYASAGHVPAFVLDGEGRLKQVLESTDIPLGLFEGRTYQGCLEFELRPGDILALLTDGITEAERPDQAQFGIRRALDFIRDHRAESARRIVDGLHDAVRDFSDGLPQRDDITAVICKCVR